MVVVVVWGIRLLKMVASSVIVTQSQIVKTAFTVLTLVYTGSNNCLFIALLNNTTVFNQIYSTLNAILTSQKPNFSCYF